MPLFNALIGWETDIEAATPLPELRAALDCPHIVTGNHKEVRKALNNAIPPAYAEYIGKAAIQAQKQQERMTPTP